MLGGLIGFNSDCCVFFAIKLNSNSVRHTNLLPLIQKRDYQITDEAVNEFEGALELDSHDVVLYSKMKRRLFCRQFSWISLALVLFFPRPALCAGLSLGRLNDSEIVLLHSVMEILDPIIAERKDAGTAPLLTFEELYAPLQPTQIQFLEQFRQLDPHDFGGTSRKLPSPSPKDRFVRLDNQRVVREGKPGALDTQYLPKPAYEAYRKMMAAMEQEIGRRLLVESGYRSPAYQLYLFLFYMPKHGYSIRETNRFVALPGCSEHGSPSRQAIDFITPGGINGEDRPAEFEELQEYGWLMSRAHEFGFQLSYPRGGPSAFEPWHWHWESGGRDA